MTSHKKHSRREWNGIFKIRKNLSGENSTSSVKIFQKTKAKWKKHEGKNKDKMKKNEGKNKDIFTSYSEGWETCSIRNANGSFWRKGEMMSDGNFNP